MSHQQGTVVEAEGTGKMLLNSEDRDLTGGRRYDAATLKKVTALAEQLQRQHEETLSASQIELIGAEVGLEPHFVRRAIEQVGRTPAAAEK